MAEAERERYKTESKTWNQFIVRGWGVVLVLRECYGVGQAKHLNHLSSFSLEEELSHSPGGWKAEALADQNPVCS